MSSGPQAPRMSGREWALLIALSVLWGGSFFFTEVVLEELLPFSVVLGRVAIAALALHVVLARRGRTIPLDGRLWLAFFAMGLLNNVIPFGLIVWGQTRITGGLAAILNATTPLWTVLLAHLLTADERMTPRRLLGVVFGFGGVVVMVGPAAIGGLGLDLLAQLAVLAGAVSYACAGVFGRRFRRLDPMTTAAGQLTASTLLVLPLALIIDRPWQIAMPGPLTWSALLGFALLSTALAYILYFRILAGAGATNLLLVTFLIPVSALLLGAGVLGEAITLQQLFGMALIGLGLATIDGRLLRWLRRSPVPAPNPSLAGHQSGAIADRRRCAPAPMLCGSARRSREHTDVAQSAEDFAADFPANPAQAEYWNTAMADKWVAHQAAIDARFARLTEYLVTRSGAAPGERVIDVGCGTGASLLALAERVTPGGSVLGIDFSRSMLALAGQRVRAAGHDQVALQLVDAQTHAFGAQAFDLLVSRFGVMFFSDPVAAFANLLGALKPGGRLAFVCWTDLAANPWFALPLEAGIRHLGEPEPAPPRAPGPFAFAEADYVREILGEAGFADVAIERTESVVEGAPSAREEAAFASQMGPVSRLIRERAPDDETVVARIASDVADQFRRFETDAGVRLPATVFFVSACRR